MRYSNGSRMQFQGNPGNKLEVLEDKSPRGIKVDYKLKVDKNPRGIKVD